MHGGFCEYSSPRPDLDHLRKQAKELLRFWRRGESTAFDRLRRALPSARGTSDAALAALRLQLHDMQSCIARECGFPSWLELKDGVALQLARDQDLRALRTDWLGLVYGGEIAGGMARSRPDLAAKVLAEQPQIIGDDPYLACATGDEAAVRRALDADAGWVHRGGGQLDLPPLIAVTHSTLARLARYREPLRQCLRLLLDRGADPSASVGNRWPPHSLERPGDERLTALYGAAGKLHDETMTRMLLAAGADGNDNESLYHSLEDPRPDLPCTRLLLDAGTRVPGTNALSKVLDYDNLAGLEMLLAHTPHGHPDLARALHWAIYRGRSAAHVRALLEAGADPRALDADNRSVYRHAAAVGLPEVMRLLEGQGTGEPLTDVERFVTACAQANEAEARSLLAAQPDVFTQLTSAQLKQLPNLAMSGRDDAVRLMVELGWPIATRGGDIDGSALNWAVFRGHPELAEFLLSHGASFREPHAYGSDVLGTLSWASINQPRPDGRWPECAAALLDHGLPAAMELSARDPSPLTRTVAIDGRRMTFATEVAEVLLGAAD